ncbi:caspase family protein [Hartmannibacter diazotrophicus]|uniref:caspase family protein n=1 Tax=Hartmannibacter diazotrophicus TaxID=1482074 RepID=UPI001AEC9682|nr:caspase family protein [Hartmannibacter diazotrophicus]
MAAAFLLVAMLCGLEPARAAERVALVIGNSAYASLNTLPNARNDAEAIAGTLKHLDFEVLLGVDIGREEMRTTIDRFREIARGASIAAVYYAGHGIQISGKNYLVPTDAVIHSADDVVATTVRFDDLLAELGRLDAFKIVFLDACQNNPLSSELGAFPDGLAPPPDVSGFLIGYATQPGKVAYEGAGRNSPYATALLTRMTARGVEVLPMLSKVNQDVRAQTGGWQVPYVQFSIKPEFYFAPGGREETDPETRLWHLATQQNDQDLLGIYLQRYPEGRFAEDARSLMAKDIGSAPALADKARPSPPADAKEVLWSLIIDSRSRDLADLYLSRYPDGPHAGEARRLAASLVSDDVVSATPELLCERLATHPNDATANVSGVSLDRLARNADTAIAACAKAAERNDENAHYKALLARSYAAKGNVADAVANYQAAAAVGDTRALVSLGLLHEAGQGVPRDRAKAVSLYEEAVAKGSSDGAINLAVALYKGQGGTRDVPRAIELLKKASADGAARATYNLGVFAKDGIEGTPEEAAGLFVKAADQGYAAGAVSAAALYDEGAGVARSPETAADLLLRAVGTDDGETLEKLGSEARNWSPETIRRIQQRLADAGYYSAEVDGQPGPKFMAALRDWRLFGGG